MIMVMMMMMMMMMMMITISKSLRQYLSDTSGKHEIKELQKTAILGTAHKLREVLM
jgi:lauroyl/myristoyl acyltransferase